jgi:hypothetical protein
VKNNTLPKSQAAHQEKNETEGAEKSKATKPAEKQQAKMQAKESGKAPEVPAPPAGSGKKAEKTSKPGKPRTPRKQHKKKGAANDAPPSSVGMTQLAFAALLAIEAANPEMTRKQIFENALKLLAGHIAYLPPIQLARLDSDSLITMSGVVAKWEASCKLIMRKIILSEYDDEEKSKHVEELETALGFLGENRLFMCRMAGIPVSHCLIADMTISIAGLRQQMKECKNKAFLDSYKNAIQILNAYKAVTPEEALKASTSPDIPGNHEAADAKGNSEESKP